MYFYMSLGVIILSLFTNASNANDQGTFELKGVYIDLSRADVVKAIAQSNDGGGCVNDFDGLDTVALERSRRKYQSITNESPLKCSTKFFGKDVDIFVYFENDKAKLISIERLGGYDSYRPYRAMVALSEKFNTELKSQCREIEWLGQKVRSFAAIIIDVNNNIITGGGFAGPESCENRWFTGI